MVDCLARRLCWKSLFQMCTAACTPLLASLCARLHEKLLYGTEFTSARPCYVWQGPRDRSYCWSAAPAKAITFTTCPPGLSPCPALSESSKQDFHCFLWQRSLQPN